MTRWDYIEYCGKEECAKAIAFCIVNTVKRNITCEEMINYVKEIQPTLEGWLSEEVDIEEELSEED